MSGSSVRASGSRRAWTAVLGSPVCLLQRRVDLHGFCRDGGFALVLAGHVPEDELDSLEHVQREEEAQANVLHRRVRNVEQEHIERERLHSRQRLQLLELRSLLALECLESGSLAGQCEKSGAEGE